jgi:hypothetical protein
MFRLLIIIVVSFSVLHCTPVDAQLFGRRHQSKRGAKLQRYDSHRQPAQAELNDRSYRTSSGLNISIGIGTFPGYGYYSGFGGYGYLDPYRFDGYGYDPYRYGSFEAPDLLKDPYFRERYRYDSQFPGRYRVPKVPRSSTAIGLADLYGFNTAPNPRGGASVLVVPPSATGDLGKATAKLARGLEVSEYGEAWLEYLAPRRLASLIARGKTAELQELLTHYDGVVANPELRYITATPGFAETRERLRRYLGQSTSDFNGRTIRVLPSTVEPPSSATRDQPEILPVPQSSAEPESRLNSANGV